MKTTAKPFGLTVSALITDGTDKFLLVRRSKQSHFFAGQWETPGGKVSPGESFDNALLREVKEETGLVIGLDGVAGVVEFELDYVRVVVLYMKAHIISGEVHLSEEHDDYAWLPLSEFNKMMLTPALRNALQRLQPN